MPNAPVESAPCGIGARRGRAAPLALFLLIWMQAVSQSSHRIETRTLKIRLPSYNIHLAIGRDGQFHLDRISQVVDEFDADALALQEVAMGGPRWVDPRTALQSIVARTSAMGRMASDHLPIVARFQFGTAAGTAAAG